MYIHEFWCGVVAVIAVEIVAVIGLAVYYGRKRK